MSEDESKDPSQDQPELHAEEEWAIWFARKELGFIDLAALDADDALIDALSAGHLTADDLLPEPVGPDDEVVAMLAAWVADVDASRVVRLPTEDSEVAASGQPPARQLYYTYRAAGIRRIRRRAAQAAQTVPLPPAQLKLLLTSVAISTLSMLLAAVVVVLALIVR